MVKPEVLALIDDEAHRDAKEVLESPENVIRFLDANEIERACCINYVSPDVMGFTREVNDWSAKFTRDHRDRLIPVGSVNPLHELNVRDEIRRVLDLGIRMIKIHPPHQLFSPNGYRSELWQLAEIYRECEERGVPVMFHTGTSVFPKARNVFADPMPIDDVAIDFPRLPIILAHARASEADKPFWKRVIETGNQTETDLDRAITLVEETGGIQETMRRARAYADAAKEALNVLPQSDIRSALAEIADFCVERAY